MELGESNKFVNTEVLEHIFSFLDVKSLLQCSLVCQNFLELTKSIKLSEKMKLSLNFGCATEEELQTLVDLLQDPDELHRRYEHVEVIKFRDAYLIEDVQETFKDFMVTIGSSLISLKFVNCEIDRDIIIELFKSLHNLQELIVDGVELEVQGAAMIDDEEIEDFPVMEKLTKFHLISSDFFFLMLIAKCASLVELTINNPSFSRTDVVKLEDFILKQTRLERLNLEKIRFNSSYSSSRLAQVPFQLRELHMENVKWDIVAHAEGFLNSQKNLLKLSIYSRNLTFRQFNRLMKANRQLQCLEVGEPLPVDGETIDDLIVPGTLCSLKMQWTSDFFSELITKLPNLTSLDILVCGETPNVTNLITAINSRTQMRQLKIHAQFFEFHTLQLPRLTKFSLKLSGIRKITAELATFFQNHPNIQELELNIHPVKADELTFLPETITSLTMQNLEITTSECVAKISSALPNLKNLKIEDAFKRTTENSIPLIMKNYGIELQILK